MPDPLAGSYFVETLTDEVERLALEYIARIDAMGGAVEAIEAGFQQDEIMEAAYAYAKSIDDDERVIVGVNKFKLDHEPEPDVFPIDPLLETGQKERLAAYKAKRDPARVQTRLADLADAARGTQNILPSIKEALRADATLGEVSDALRGVFGVYSPR
jgi:methylmalonyl-CoA mutase N-terminal domain/subunit